MPGATAHGASDLAKKGEEVIDRVLFRPGPGEVAGIGAGLDPLFAGEFLDALVPPEVGVDAIDLDPHGRAVR